MCSRKKAKKWESKYDNVLAELYPDTENKAIAETLGYSMRTIERHAAWLGLRKSLEFMHEHQVKASREGVRWFEYMRITGQKIPARNNTGRWFQKGRIPDEKIEAKRIAAIRQTAWEDRIRIINGFKPKSKWRFNLKAYEKLKENDNGKINTE